MILEKMAALARPVRIAANSSRAWAMAPSIFSSASRRVSSITLAPSCRDRSAGGDQCPDLLTTDGLDDGVLPLRAEDQHGQAVVHAEAERGRVGDPQPLPERFAEGDGVDLTGGRVDARVGGLAAVDAVRALHD